VDGRLVSLRCDWGLTSEGQILARRVSLLADPEQPGLGGEGRGD
jgi:hypothetical protein